MCINDSKRLFVAVEQRIRFAKDHARKGIMILRTQGGFGCFRLL